MRGGANAPYCLCSLLLEQESRLGPGEKLDWDGKQGSQKGDSEQRKAFLRERNPGWLQAALGPPPALAHRREAMWRRVLRWGFLPALGGAPLGPGRRL